MDTKKQYTCAELVYSFPNRVDQPCGKPAKGFRWPTGDPVCGIHKRKLLRLGYNVGPL